MKEKYLLIPSNYSIKPFFIEVDPEYLLQDMKSFMLCDHVECTYKPYEDGTLVFIVDELGKVKSPPSAVNMLASMLYDNPNDFLVGAVVIGWIGSRNGETDIVPLPPKVMEKLCDICGILPPEEE